jgi:hypothetical protein
LFINKVVAMLCVSLLIYGGLAGGLQRPPHVVAAAQLSASDQQQLLHLVQALQASPPPPVTSPGQGRDLQGYLITIEQAGKAPEQFEANDLTRNQAFATLSQWILNKGSTGGGAC